MEKLYNRVDNLDELIRSAKLPYLAWKVLFLVSKDIDKTQISEILEESQDKVDEALQKLTERGLITTESGKETAKESDSDKEVIPDLDTDSEPEVDEKTVDLDEPEASEQIEETADEFVEEKVEQELDVEEEEIKKEQTKEPEPEREKEELKDEETKDEKELEEIEETEQATEPVSESEEQEEDTTFQELAEETSTEIDENVETEGDETSEAEGDEKIEINIPEEESSEELEFNFNLSDQEEQTVEQETVETEDLEKVDKSGYKKILVIDDSLVIRKMVEIALEEEEFQIETAVSGKEGLDIIDQTNPDLVILDMMLPDINGIEILKTIKASRGIPVIMLSGKDSPQMIETAKAEGAEEFLPKPFKDDDLVEKIKSLLNN